MKNVALIIAGGSGKRFWPKSTNSLPKQFLSLDKSEETLIQKTVKRIQPIVANEDIYVITGKQYHSLVRKQLPSLPQSNVLIEPSGRNTAPAIELSVEYIKAKYEDCIMIVLPCDHMVMNEPKYIELLQVATNFVENNHALVTIGVKPTSPNTGYGYINATEKTDINNLLKVNKFVEKPDLATAEKYLASGDYYWNAGMFIWKLSDIDEAFKKYMPKQYKAFRWLFSQRHFKFKKFFEKVFDEQEKISIDYGIMEKADNIYTVTGDFGWDDVGSWQALERINKPDDQGNTVVGEKIVYKNTNDSIIFNDTKKLIAIVGVKDLVVVHTDEVTFVSTKEHASEVKDLVKKLEEENMKKYI